MWRSAVSPRPATGPHANVGNRGSAVVAPCSAAEISASGQFEISGVQRPVAGVGCEPHGRTNLMLGSEPDGQFDWGRRHAIPPVMGSGRGFRVSDFGKRRRARGVRMTMTMTMTMRMSRRAWGQKRLNAEGQRTQSIAKSTNLVPGDGDFVRRVRAGRASYTSPQILSFPIKFGTRSAHPSEVTPTWCWAMGAGSFRISGRVRAGQAI